LKEEKNQDKFEKNMGNENCRSISTLLHLEDTDPSERIERLMNLERLSLEEKLSALKRDANTESA